MWSGWARGRAGLRCGLAAVALVGMLATGCGRGGSATPAPEPVGEIALDAAVVSTAAGPVRGIVGADHRVFQGIPYAASPVGPLRWQPPRPAARWSAVRDASSAGPWCVQEVGAAAEQLTSEDCLTLNVWTPTGVVHGQRPVLVWIHGGGFVKGSGDIYHAARMAVRGEIVVVTINYRLGVLGFLADPALGEPGNYGLADQQAALRWVRDNITNFGGDPAKVTIAGESAGAMSVCDHLVAPASAGLFRAAIIQSGPCQAQAEPETARQVSREYTARLGCAEPPWSDSEVAACLRALSANRLADPLWYVRFGTDQLSGPVVRTPSLPVDPVRGFRDGRAARVPVLIGTNRDEFTLFVALRYLRMGREPTAAEYPGVLADTFGADAAEAVSAHYPPQRYGNSVSLAYATAATDDVFACPAEQMVAGLVETGPAVYAYEFDDPRAPAPETFRQVPFPLGASHSLELRYLFDVGGAPALDSAQRQLADQMIDYWSQFVVTGAPKAAGQPDWPAVDDGAGGRWLLLRADGSRVITDFAVAHRCAFWATLRH